MCRQFMVGENGNRVRSETIRSWTIFTVLNHHMHDVIIEINVSEMMIARARARINQSLSLSLCLAHSPRELIQNRQKWDVKKKQSVDGTARSTFMAIV